MFIF
ncbi:similar to LOC387763 protein (predicted) [Rattus norvegicus]|jgi:hypothetical protein